MIYRLSTFFFSALMVLTIWSNPALAVEANDIAENIVESTSQLPGLITGLSYALGLLLGVTGVLKLKEHVDNPNQAPMRAGLIRLLAGGALFALPIVYEAMETAINGTGEAGVFDFSNNTAGGILSNLFGLLGTIGITGDINNLLANFVDAIEDVPALIAAFAYLVGLYLGVMGILKIKEHVEDPTRAEMREGVIRLLIGGAFFAIPTVYEAMQNAISGGGLGIFGEINSVLGELSIYHSSEAAGDTCGNFNSSVGNAICNFLSSSASAPAFLETIAYLIGLIFGFWGLIKLRDGILRPDQTPLWEGISRLIAGGMFFALPFVTEAIRATVAPGSVILFSAGRTNTGFNNPGDAAASGEACAPTGALAEATGGLDTALICFMNDIFGPLHVALNFFGFTAGVLLIMIGISRLVKSTQEGAKGPIGLGTFMTIITGGVLLSFNGILRTFSSSFFASPITYTYAELSYTNGLNEAMVNNSYAVIAAVIQFMILIGLISFMRGFFILRSVAEGGGQASVMAGVTHIIGGALAVNLGPVINAVQSTLGFEVIQFT